MWRRVDAAATAFSHRGALCEWGLPVEPVGRGCRRRERAVDARDGGGDASLHNRQRLRQSNRPGERRGLCAHQSRLRAKFERLVAVKNKYDPTNLFRHNQNIEPIGVAAKRSCRGGSGTQRFRFCWPTPISSTRATPLARIGCERHCRRRLGGNSPCLHVSCLNQRPYSTSRRVVRHREAREQK